MWRIALVLLVIALALSISEFLADGFNNPRIPAEASLCFGLIVLVIAGLVTILTTLYRKWKGTPNVESKS